MNPYSNMSKLTDNFSLSTLSIPSIRLTDIVDIILVAVLIYIVLKWIRETQAWTLFKGIIVIVIVSLLSYQFHFYTLSWIIEKTFSVGVIALLVIFQPELRRALEQIGRGGFTSIVEMLKMTDNTHFNQNSVDALVTACKYISKTEAGALIAIERKSKITPSNDCVLLDANISHQILANIFIKNTPLHDGGVIIRDNRIRYASAIFPVSESSIGQELGTRHRAAVGVSEVYDAYVIVVSEENHKVSLATNGKLERNISFEELGDRLKSLIVTDDTPRSFKQTLKNYAQVEIPIGKGDKKGDKKGGRRK
jgi:diadenylate cyclase